MRLPREHSSILYLAAVSSLAPNFSMVGHEILQDVLKVLSSHSQSGVRLCVGLTDCNFMGFNAGGMPVGFLVGGSDKIHRKVNDIIGSGQHTNSYVRRVSDIPPCRAARILAFEFPVLYCRPNWDEAVKFGGLRYILAGQLNQAIEATPRTRHARLHRLTETREMLALNGV